MRERMSRWARNVRVSSAYNTNKSEAEGTHLQGGESACCFDDAESRIINMGVDETLMGRWTWVRLGGKNGLATKIYSAYRPCKNYGENGVYAQQIRALSSNGDTRCPQKAMMEDLKKDMMKAKESGDQIILAADFNTEINGEEIRELMDDLAMENAITERHGEEGPPTYRWGSKQIDTILVSRSIRVTACGYLSFECTPGDHRPIWIDITYQSIYGNTQPRINTKNARRLQSNHPRSVKKYLSTLKKKIKDENIHVLAENQVIEGRQDPTKIDQEAMDRIFGMLHKAMKDAEKECRNFYAGGRPWSPKLARARAAVSYWRMVVTAKKTQK